MVEQRHILGGLDDSFTFASSLHAWILFTYRCNFMMQLKEKAKCTYKLNIGMWCLSPA